MLALALAAAPCARGASLWESEPAKIIQTIDADFPAALLMQGVREGEVRAVLNIDAEGRLADYLIAAYTHRELAAELIKLLGQWRYEPARRRGEPTGSRVEIAFDFRARGTVLSLTPTDVLNAQLGGLLGHAPTVLVCRADELDQPLAVVRSVSPYHPGKSLTPPQPRGSAVIDFYIDAAGRPRMPVVMRATHEAFAAAAVEALTQWEFTPPLCDGRPVAVRVQQEFVFTGGS